MPGESLQKIKKKKKNASQNLVTTNLILCQFPVADSQLQEEVGLVFGTFQNQDWEYLVLNKAI